MLRQEELAFIKALSKVETSPLLLRELKKAVTAGKKKALAARKANASVGEARTSRDPLLLSAPKRKAEELSGSDYLSEPASRPAPQHQLLPATATATGEQAASGSRQPGSSGVGAMYAAVLSASVAPSQPSGTLKPTAMGSDSSETGVSMETSERRMSQDMSGPLSGTPDGTTDHTHVATACIPAGQRPNKTPIFISGVSDTRAFLALLRAFCLGGLVAKLKAERLVVVPPTADGFRAAVTTLRALDGKEGVSFHTFTLPEDRCVRLPVKNLGRSCLTASYGMSWNP